MKSSYLFIAAAIVLASCKKEKDQPAPTHTVEGRLLNTTDRPVRNATVTLSRLGQTTSAFTATTDTGGRYSLKGVGEGQWLARFERPGFTSDADTITVSGNLSVNKLIKGEADIRGVIINSQTGFGLANARVYVTAATGSETEDTSGALADFSVTTDASGVYRFDDVATGSMVRVTRANGFIVDIGRNLTANTGQNDWGNSTIVEELGQGAMRIVLTWGASPNDLDSHLSGPDSTGGRFHCYFSNTNPVGASLDVDKTTGFGPETVTIPTLRNGVYRYSVHNYTNRSSTSAAESISTSGAIVKLYDSNGLVGTYTPPAPTPGNTWRVFEVNAAGVVTVLNTYRMTDYSDGSQFRTDGTKAPMSGKEF